MSELPLSNHNLPLLANFDAIRGQQRFLAARVQHPLSSRNHILNKISNVPLLINLPFPLHPLNLLLQTMPIKLNQHLQVYTNSRPLRQSLPALTLKQRQRAQSIHIGLSPQPQL